MILYKTRYNKEAECYPTLLDFKQVEYERELLSAFEIEFSLKRHQAIEMAKNNFLEILTRYGKEDWVILKDYWNKYDDVIGLDYILLTRHACYIFEIAAFNGKFEYTNKKATVNGEELYTNIIHETNYAHEIIQEICQQVAPTLSVKSALLLMGDNPPIPFDTTIEHVQLVTKDQLSNYIQAISTEEATYTGQAINSKKIIHHLERFEVAMPYPPRPYTYEELENIQKGIHCERCADYSIKISQTLVHCSCGHLETLEQATVRTICEYGVLTYDNDELSPLELKKFFNYQISDRYLYEILTKYFVFTS